MKNIVFLLLVSLVFFPEFARADSAPPSKYINLSFWQNDQQITEPVDFTIICFGQTYDYNFNLKEEIEEVSHYSGTCENAARCQFGSPNLFEVYKSPVKYCDITGKIDNQQFTVHDFLGPDMAGLNCQRADFDISSDAYYKETLQYDECRKDVYREYYPQGNGNVEGEFICNQYRTDDKLIPTDISTEPNGPCYRYGYTIKNNICYQIPQSFYDCTAGEDKKMEECDKYLEDVTDKLIMDENGYPYFEICTADINLSTDNLSNKDIQTEIQKPDTPKDPSAQPANWFVRLINFIQCLWSGLFGRPCR